MASNEGSSAVAIVAIVIIVLLAIGGYYFFVNQRASTTPAADVTKVDVNVPKPADNAAPAAPATNQ